MSATTTRRSALHSAGLTGLSALIGSVGAKAASPTPDAKLIKTCRELLALQAEFAALFDQRMTIADEHRTDSELLLLYDREVKIQDRLSALPPPVTLLGARAMARIAVARWRLFNGEELAAEDFDEWIGLSIAEYLAGDVVA